mmetsp:Transcript_27880/g.50439  ORF Transcript_27880/g.50439 Transcript_27880/m.50439 type:complete len:99 (+) Transcript_27880:142-438(+)
MIDDPDLNQSGYPYPVRVITGKTLFCWSVIKLILQEAQNATVQVVFSMPVGTACLSKTASETPHPQYYPMRLGVTSAPLFSLPPPIIPPAPPPHDYSN